MAEETKPIVLNPMSLEDFSKKMFSLSQDSTNKVVFYLGAGCSVTSGIDSGATLVKRWLDEQYQEKYRAKFKDKKEALSFEDWVEEKFPGYSETNAGEFYPEVMDWRFRSPEEKQKEIEENVKGAVPGVGYYALAKLMEGHGGFEHNLHGLRVVDILEQKYPNFPGLNLSWEVKESIVKHISPYDHTSTTTEYNIDERPLLEAQIVDKADSIAYDNHDLDDSLKAGIITDSDLQTVDLWRETQKKVKKKYVIDNHDILIAQTIRTLINVEVTDLLENTLSMLKREGIKTVKDVRNHPGLIVSFSPALSEQKKKLQNFLFKNVYQHYRVARMSDKAKRFLEELFIAFIKNPKQLPAEYQRWIEEAGLYQGVCDYIAGMTDRFAQDEYKKLFYPYERV